MSDEAIRTFIAVALDASARDAATEVARVLRSREHGDAVRWVRPEGMHVTLRFLGDIEPAQVAPLAEQVGAEVARCAPFELHLGVAHLFPSSRRPRVVTLEIAPEEPLAALAAAVERGTAGVGFEPEGRPFRGHLTLGRMKGRRPPSVRGVGAPDTAFPVTEVVLFRSELHLDGAKYTPLERMALGG